MRNTLMATAFVMSAGLLWTALPARAQTLNPVADPVASSGAVGTYDATITEINPTLFDVSVIGVDDGGNTKTKVDQIDFTFAGDTVASGVGGTNLPWSNAPIDNTITYGVTGSADPVDRYGINTPPFTGSTTLANAFTSGAITVALQGS